MRNLTFAFLGVISAFALLFMSLPITATAQTNSLSCGSVVKGKFRQDSQADTYNLSLNEGDKVVVNVKAAGDTLTLGLTVADPVGRYLYWTGEFIRPLAKEWNFESPTLSGDGTYSVIVWNKYFNNRGGVGSYTVSIECTLGATGKVIKPGDITNPTTATQTTTPNSESANAPTSIPFSGVGFPGLSSKDFSDAIEVSLQAGAPFTGTLRAGSDDVLSLKFEGKVGNTTELDFARISGNLNFCIVLLSADNTVLFQTALVSADNVLARIRLPVTGQYTIGIYQTELSTPAKPERTTFRVLMKLSTR